jgi:hypothetical protein
VSATVTARWDGFLAQIHERFRSIMREALSACPMLLEQAGWDPIPMSTAWGAIEMRSKQLETKIEETWSSQVERAFEQAGASPQLVAHERSKGDAMRDAIEVERERTRIAIFADAGRRFFARATSERGRTFPCSRCGAPLDVPFTFRALNVACTHCTTVNGFEPGTNMRMGEICVHPLCEEAAWDQWLAMHRAEEGWRAARGATIQLLKTWERAQLGFWHAYLSARIRFLPDTAKDFDKDLRGRMAHFYDRMDREPAWIQAGRPRDLVSGP